MMKRIKFLIEAFLPIFLILLVCQISFSDDYDAYTVFMCHFDGTDGATTADEEDFDGGNTHTLVFVNQAQIDTDVSPKFGTGSLMLDGSDSVYSVDSTDWDLTGDFVIDFWVYTASPDSFGFTVSTYQSDGTRWNTYFHDTPGLKFYQVSPAIDLVSSDNNISSNTWSHVAWVHSSGNWYVYSNGTRIMNETGESDNFLTNTGILAIGDYNGTGSYGFTGHIDELRICKGTDRGWTGATITVPVSAYSKTESSPGGQDANTKLLLHLNGVDAATSTTDATSRHSTINFNGTAQLDTAQKKWGTASLLLDGNSDYLDIPDSVDWDIEASDSEDWTVDFWAKSNDSYAVSEEYYIGQYEDSQNRWSFYHNSTSGVTYRYRSGGTNYVSISDNIISDSNWHHIALIKVSTDYGVYVDGQQISYASNSTTDTFAGSLYIGVQEGSAGFLNGWMDEIRVQNSNYFSAAPVVGETDTIVVPTEEYSNVSTRNRMIFH